MKYEVKIVLSSETNKSENGSVLENLIRYILERQEYDICQNIHFTGLEIDLIAKHRFKNELLYVECKAKEKPKSTEIKNFIYGVDYGVEDHSVDYGYFIHTEELDRQAGALKLKLESTKKNVTFIGPEKIVQLLTSGQLIQMFPFDLPDKPVTKIILICTIKGYFYAVILQDGVLPSHVIVCNANNFEETVSQELITELKNSIKEIKDLQVISSQVSSESIFNKVPESAKDKTQIETITEIKESEHWYDYSPASIDHFIGRVKLRKELINFIEDVKDSKTRNRIFYLDGKSGWGKSSLIAELRGRSKKPYWKNSLHVLAIDTRSAVTTNFVVYSFKKLLDDILASGFIPKSIFNQNLIITSPFDTLSDTSVKELFREIRRRNKVLVLIFDQFEDIFRKEDLFEPFYKFLLDVNDFQENLIVGFSWKSEINIPIGNPAYHLFTQVKDYSLNLKVPEFGLNDVKSVIKQLEKAINQRLGNELERRLIDASQGFPWLIKKLCIHTFIQYNEGRTIEELIDQDLNIKSLFDSDLKKLTKEESLFLKFIAERSYDENSIDISEIDEVNQDALSQLIHKRLVIKTGTKYNIYWDIFRDYLVTGDVPVIGESFLIRQSPKACMDLFRIFNDKQPKTLDQLIANYPTTIIKKTLWNILFELRSIGLIKRVEGKDIFELTNKSLEVSREGFSEYVTFKFQNYTPYLELLKIEKQRITLDNIVRVLKAIFKTSQFHENTWKAYALNLVLWIRASNLEIKRKIVATKKGRAVAFHVDYQSVFYNTPKVVLSGFSMAVGGNIPLNRIAKDLHNLGLLTQSENLKFRVAENQIGYDTKSHGFLASVSEQALKFEKIHSAYLFIKTHPTSNVTFLISNNPELVKGYKTQKSKNQIGSVILSWAKFIYNVLDNQAVDFKGRGASGEKSFFSYSAPKEIERLHAVLMENNVSRSDKLQRVKIRLLMSYELFFETGSTIGNLKLKNEYRNLYHFKESLLHLASKESDINAVLLFAKNHPKYKIAELVQGLPNLFAKYSTSVSKYNNAARLSLWSKEIIRTNVTD